MSHDPNGLSEWMAQMVATTQHLQSSMADLNARNASLQEEVYFLKTLPQKTTGSFDPNLTPSHYTSFEYPPNDTFMERCTFNGIPLLTAPFFLSPLSADEKRTFAAQTHSVRGVDYTAPPVPKGVLLQGDNKLHDSQLREIQFQAGQLTKWLDYYMERETRSLALAPDDPLPHTLETLVNFRRLLSNHASEISQTRLENMFRMAKIDVKAPIVSPSTAPELVDPKIIMELLAEAETAKRLWAPPVVKPTVPKNHARRGGHLPRPPPPYQTPAAAAPAPAPPPVAPPSQAPQPARPRPPGRGGFQRPPTH